MKYLVKGKIISEFFGLRSKMYSLVFVNNGKIKKAKDVNKNVNKSMRHKEYVDVLFNKNLIRHKMKRIRNKLHRIGTYNVCKISLSFFDDKRFILDDGNSNGAYFHKNVKS